jgi:hypothetical protein
MLGLLFHDLNSYSKLAYRVSGLMQYELTISPKASGFTWLEDMPNSGHPMLVRRAVGRVFRKKLFSLPIFLSFEAFSALLAFLCFKAYSGLWT